MSPEEAQQVSERDETLLGDAEKPKMNELSHPLSAREKEVVMLIASGFSCRKVASKLGITFNTARAHRYSAMVKMKVNNASSLLHAAIRLGLIEPPQP